MDELGGWLAQLRKGTVELLVLWLLVREGELHGYAIVQQLQSLGRLVAGESTVYPVLKRLEADGYVAAKWSEAESGPPRKYYRLTDAGSEFLSAANHEWDALVESMRELKGAGDE